MLDRETGLVWERDPVTAHPFNTSANWGNAKPFCVQAMTGGRAGWRLPFIHELASLFDTSVAFPLLALPAGHPFLNVVAGQYWSATEQASFPGVVAFAVKFQGKLGVLTELETSAENVWCVRGGGSLCNTIKSPRVLNLAAKSEQIDLEAKNV